MMDTETIFLFIGFFPFFALGIGLLILGAILKKNHGKPDPLAIKAKVVDIQTDDTRSDGYLVSRKYYITVEYEKNGEFKINTFKSDYEYEIDTLIDIKVSLSGAVLVLTKPTIKNTGNTNIPVAFNGYKVCNGIGSAILIICALMFSVFISEDVQLYGIMIALSYLAFLAFRGAFKQYKKAKNAEREIKDGTYEKITAKIVDIQREYHRDSDGSGGHYSYNPIVEFNDDGMIRTKKVYISTATDLGAIGSNVTIYKHKKTDDVMTELDRKISYVPSILLCIAGGFPTLLVLLSLIDMF